MKAFVIIGMAIGGIVILEVVALLNGINGTMLGLAIASIAGLGGYEVRHGQDIIKKRKRNRS